MATSEEKFSRAVSVEISKSMELNSMDGWTVLDPQPSEQDMIGILKLAASYTTDYISSALYMTYIDMLAVGHITVKLVVNNETQENDFAIELTDLGMKAVETGEFGEVGQVEVN